MSERSCLDCRHVMCWKDYEQAFEDCQLAADDIGHSHYDQKWGFATEYFEGAKTFVNCAKECPYFVRRDTQEETNSIPTTSLETA
jgi:hypothetical protein